MRVLSLDGGGSWALIQAKALGALYPGLSGHEILAKFDIAIGTSGGSITLAGLVKNLTPKQIAALFMDRASRDSIFVGLNGYHPIPRYFAERKLAGLRAIIGAPLADGSLAAAAEHVEASTGRAIRLVITGYDVDRQRAVLFRSQASTLEGEEHPFSPSLAGAVHASTNAPVVYFDKAAVVADVNDPARVRRFWDGAIGGNNNPVLAGVMEAIEVGGGPVSALSIGTAETWLPEGPPLNGEPQELFRQPIADKLLEGVEGLAKAILNGPPDTASLHAHLLTRKGPVPSVVRMNPRIMPLLSTVGGRPRWEVDPVYATLRGGAADATFVALRDMDMDATAQEDVDLIAALADAWIAGAIPNQPILANGTTGRGVVGDGDFPAAGDSWLRLTAAGV